MSQVFNKGIDSDEKQEGLLKRLKNIEDKTDNQLKENKDSQLGIQSIGYIVKEELSQEAKNILKKLSNQEKIINHKKTLFKTLMILNIILLIIGHYWSFLRGFITEKLQ